MHLASHLSKTDFKEKASIGKIVLTKQTHNEHPMNRFSNSKNGNKYFSWVYVEAANFVVRGYPYVHRYYNYRRTHQRHKLKENWYKSERASTFFKGIDRNNEQKGEG